MTCPCMVHWNEQSAEVSFQRSEPTTLLMLPRRWFGILDHCTAITGTVASIGTSHICRGIGDLRGQFEQAVDESNPASDPEELCRENIRS